jgi:hypothetical protein
VLIDLLRQRRDRGAGLGIPAVACFPILLGPVLQLQQPLVSLKNLTLPVIATCSPRMPNVKEGPVRMRSVPPPATPE